MISSRSSVWDYAQSLPSQLLRRPLYPLLVLGIFGFFIILRYQWSSRVASHYWQDPQNLSWDHSRNPKSLLLDSHNCQNNFPGLFQEVDRLVIANRDSPITKETLDAVERRNGYIRGMLYDQQLYIIATQGGIYSRGLATLQALHRAIVTSPTPLPNIEFVLSTDDKLPPLPIWSYARHRDDSTTWLMPDFGFWSWPETKVGTYGEVQRKAMLMEETADNPSQKAWYWKHKYNKLLWRGATMGLELRDKFIKVTTGKPWADVKAIEWHNADSMGADLKSMDEHCQYKYLAHTEGNSYSGRLKYLQNCQSVIVAHDMDWIQHYTPLMKSSGSSQNYVRVRRDFSDLEKTMLKLQKDDKWAALIAENSKKTFAGQYLTTPAEVCYWRRLIRGWAEASFEPTPWELKNGTQQWRGVAVESYLLERRLEWDPY